MQQLSTVRDGPQGRSARRRLVCIADPNQLLRTMLTTVFELEGYQTCEIVDGDGLLARVAEGMSAFHPTPMPDVIVTALAMPGFPPLTLVETLRFDRWDVPVVMLIQSTDVARSRVSRLGRTAVLDKPIDLDELVAAVKAIEVDGVREAVGRA